MTDSPYQRIIVAIDADEQGEALAARAGSIATLLDCRLLQAISVVEPLPPPAATGLAEAMPAAATAEVEVQRQSDAQRRLEAIAKVANLDPAGLRIRSGNVTDEILRAADEINADLIVVGTHGRSGIGRLLGSNASAIVHQAPCDVLTIHLED